MSRSPPSAATLGVAVCVGCIMLAVVLVGGATAGDNVAEITVEPGEQAAEPGEEVDIGVYLRSHGAYGDAGVARIELRADAHPEYLTITDVTAGDWFEDAPGGDPLGGGDEDVSVTEFVDHDPDAGASRLTQRLDDPDEGVTGFAHVATVTVAVAEDADPATVEVSFAESDVFLTSRYPQPLAVAPAEVAVDGGGETVEPRFAADAFEDDASNEGDTETPTAEEDTPNDGDASSSDDTSTATDETVPAPAGAAVVGLLVAGLLFRRR